MVLWLIIAYCLGAFPTGDLFAGYKKVDLRKVGSGSSGATNVTRALGPLYGFLTGVIDALKGVSVVVGAHYLHLDPFFLALSALLVVYSQQHSIFKKERFHGGKGIATSLGVVACLQPNTAVLCVVVWVVTMLLWRYVSLASIAAALSVVVAQFVFAHDPVIRVVIFSIAVMDIARHESNIDRLLAGTESKFSLKSK